MLPLVFGVVPLPRGFGKRSSPLLRREMLLQNTNVRSMFPRPLPMVDHPVEGFRGSQLNPLLYRCGWTPGRRASKALTLMLLEWLLLCFLVWL